MKTWKKTGVAFMAALLLAAPMTEGIRANQGVVAQAENGKSQKSLAATEAQRMAETLIDGYGISGVQYALRSEGEIVLSGGLGIDEAGNKAPIGKDAMFGIGSISKMYVTAAAMMLADAGKVDIDAPLTDYIPDFKMADERYKQITPRMLMNHSAGLYGTHYRNSSLFVDNDSDNNDALLQHLRSEQLKSDPGEYSVYANDGFQLLEILVERVSGMDYSGFLAKSFSEPLKLTSTKTPLDSFDRSQMYPVRLPGIKGVLPVENMNTIGAGGLYSTAEEVTLFSEVLTGRRPDLLSEASALAMRQPEYRRGVWVNSDSNIFSYGLGWDAVNLPPFNHYGIQALAKGGDTSQYHAAYIALPEQGVSIALLTAGGNSMFNTAAASHILLSYLKETGVITDIQPNQTFEAPIQKEMPDSLNVYSGLYGTVGSTLSITLKNGKINLPDIYGLIPEQFYVYTGDGAFTGEDGRTILSFDEQSNGHIYIRVQSVLEAPGIGQVPVDIYMWQKLESHTVSDSVKQVWNERNGKIYYAVDEKIKSLEYLTPQSLIKTVQLEDGGGYANGTIIKDSSHAVNIVEIPVMMGRDTYDLAFFEENGIEYLQSGGRTFINEEAVTPIYNGRASTATIPASGHARWFQVGKGAGGRTMTADFAKSSGFAVYDGNGMPVHISAANGGHTVVLPESGLIVFGGEAGDVFKIMLEPSK
jgi:CubicO group peptidase (beta-lactamase class C family)